MPRDERLRPFDPAEINRRPNGRPALLDLRFRAQLLLDGVERGELRGADVIELDDVPAELGLHRRFGVLALFQLRERLGERLYESARRIPVEIAPLFLRSRILA